MPRPTSPPQEVLRASGNWHSHSVDTGDARDIIPRMKTDPSRTVVITDPPWPNCERIGLEGGDAALHIWADVASLLPRIADRLVLWLSNLVDPRGMVDAVPAALPFVGVVWMPWSVPAYRGPRMLTADVAYVFGKVRLPPGRRVLSGRAPPYSGTHKSIHPCPRNLAMARWLINNYAAKSDLIVDPFCGSGTTLVAAAELGIGSHGIEVAPEYANLSSQRVSDEAMQGQLAGTAVGVG